MQWNDDQMLERYLDQIDEEWWAGSSEDAALRAAGAEFDEQSADMLDDGEPSPLAAAEPPFGGRPVFLVEPLISAPDPALRFHFESR